MTTRLAFAATLLLLTLPARAADPATQVGEVGTMAVRFTTAVPVEAAAVSTILWDPRSGGFDAVLDLGKRLMRVQGLARMEAEIPVPTRRIQAGETIAADDLTPQRVPAARLD